MLTADFDLTNLLGRTGALNYGGHSDGETEPLLAAFRQAGDAERLVRCKIEGRALLKGVVRARMQLGSNVAWPYALENMYFNLL